MSSSLTSNSVQLSTVISPIAQLLLCLAAVVVAFYLGILGIDVSSPFPVGKEPIIGASLRGLAKGGNSTFVPESGLGIAELVYPVRKGELNAVSLGRFMTCRSSFEAA